jgi:hypothetical protein
MSRKRGVYMGVYCDGNDVRYWKELIKDKDVLLKHINFLYQKFNIPKAKDVISKYWKEVLIRAC